MIVIYVLKPVYSILVPTFNINLAGVIGDYQKKKVLMTSFYTYSNKRAR